MQVVIVQFESKRLVKFFSMGVASTVTYLAVAYFLNNIQPNSPEINSVIAYLAGMVTSFLGQRRITFQSSGKISTEFLKFMVLSAIGLATSYYSMQITVSKFHLEPIWGNLLVCALVPLINYFAMLLWIFKSPDVPT